MQKNVAAQKWIVFAFEDQGATSPGEPVTGDAANITANVRIDGGAANAVDDTNPTELEGGYYVFDITAAESNGDLLVLAPSSSTANVNVIGVPGAVWTTPANFPALGIEADGHAHADVKEWIGTAVTLGSGAPDVNIASSDDIDLTATQKTSVNAEVDDVLNTDTHAEPSGVPAANEPIGNKVGYVFMALRNQVNVTNTKKTFYDDAGAAEWEKDLSDDGTTYSESEGNAI